MGFSEDQIIQIAKTVLLFSIIFDTLLIAWVWRVAEEKTEVVHAYMVFISSVVMWEVVAWFGFFYAGQFSEVLQTVTDKLTFSLGAAVAFTLVYFFWLYCDRQFLSRRVIQMYGLFCLGIIFLVSFSRLVINGRGYAQATNYHYWYEPGPLMALFYASFFFAIFFATYLLIVGYRSSQGISRAQLLLVGSGLTFPVYFAIVINTTYPLYYLLTNQYEEVSGGTNSLYLQVLSAVLLSIMGLTVGYAITRYRAFHIKVVLHNVAFYRFLVAAWSVAFFCMSTLLVFTFGSPFVALVCTLVYMALFTFVNTRIKDFVHNIAFKHEIDFTKKFPHWRDIFSSTKEMTTFVLRVAADIQVQMPVEVLQFYMIQRQHNRLHPYYSYGKGKSISLDTAWIQKYVAKAGVYTRSDVSETLASFMKKQNAEYVWVFADDERVQGAVLISNIQSTVITEEEVLKDMNALYDKVSKSVWNQVFCYESLEGIIRSSLDEQYSEI